MLKNKEHTLKILIFIFYICTILSNYFYAPWDTILINTGFDSFYKVNDLLSKFVLYGVFDQIRCGGLAITLIDDLSIVKTVAYDNEEVYILIQGISLLVTTVVFFLAQALIIKICKRLEQKSTHRIEHIAVSFMLNNSAGYIELLISYTLLKFLIEKFPEYYLNDSELIIPNLVRFILFLLMFIGDWAALILMLSTSIYGVFVIFPIVIVNELTNTLGLNTELMNVITSVAVIGNVCLVWGRVQDKVITALYHLLIFPIVIVRKIRVRYDKKKKEQEKERELKEKLNESIHKNDELDVVVSNYKTELKLQQNTQNELQKELVKKQNENNELKRIIEKTQSDYEEMLSENTIMKDLNEELKSEIRSLKRNMQQKSIELRNDTQNETLKKKP